MLVIIMFISKKSTTVLLLHQKVSPKEVSKDDQKKNPQSKHFKFSLSNQRNLRTTLKTTT